MLVLSRRKDESIILGDDILITIVRIDKGNVRIGITAPKEVPIHRKEIYDEIKRQQSSGEQN
jgi:carbon storage regulator